MNFVHIMIIIFTFRRLDSVKTFSFLLLNSPFSPAVTLVPIFRVSKHRHGRCQRHALRYVKWLKREIGSREPPGIKVINISYSPRIHTIRTHAYIRRSAISHGGMHADEMRMRVQLDREGSFLLQADEGRTFTMFQNYRFVKVIMSMFVKD